MKKILITGGNRGIGKAIATKLVGKRHHVVIVSRNRDRGIEAINEIKALSPAAYISCMQGELSTIAGCYQLVEDIKSQHPDLSVLINNAGIWMTEKQLNNDGLELSFMVNYIAPFILATNLRQVLESNAPSRIVNVNAGLYVKGKLKVNDTPYGKDFHPIRTYANTKLCGAIFTLDFAKLISGGALTINAVHPGVIRTGLGDSDKFISKLVGLFKIFWKHPDYGAQAPVWLAISNEVEGINGKYFNIKKEMEYTERAKNEKLRLELWNKTLEIVQEGKFN